MDKNCLTQGSLSFFLEGGWWGVFIIYLKIEKAHSSFHKGDQSNGFCQWPSFQVMLKPVNKLNTQRQSHAQLINKAHCSRARKTNPQSRQNQVICPSCVTQPCLVLLSSHLFSLLFAVTHTGPDWSHRLVTSFGGIDYIFSHVRHKMLLICHQYSNNEEKTKTEKWMVLFFKMVGKKNSNKIFYVQHPSLKIHRRVK